MALTHVLLFFHLLGAVSFFAGVAVVGTLQLAALRRDRPSEVYALLRLAPVGAALVGAGALLTLAFGIALAEHELVRLFVVEVDEARVGLERRRDLVRDEVEHLLEVERRVDGRDRVRQEPQVTGGFLHPSILGAPGVRSRA